MNKKIKVKNNELLATFLIDKGTLAADTDIGAAKLEIKNGDAWVDVTKAGTNKANEKYFAPETEVTVRITVGDDKKATSGFDKFECKKADGTTAFTPAIAFTPVTEGADALTKIATFPMPAEDCKVIGSLKKLVTPTFKSVKINNVEIDSTKIQGGSAAADIVVAGLTKATLASKITEFKITVGTEEKTLVADDYVITPPTNEFSATAEEIKIKIKAKDGMWLELAEIKIKVKTS